MLIMDLNRTPCEGAVHWISMKRFEGHNEFLIRRLGHPRMQLDRHANRRARRRGQDLKQRGTFPLTSPLSQHGSRDCRNDHSSCVLSISSYEISLEPASPTDPLSVISRDLI